MKKVLKTKMDMANIIKQEQAAFQYTPEQIELIKSQIAPRASDTELQLFLYHCQRTGLDALSRQIYCIHRKEDGKDKMTIQTSIDGFRVIAERSGNYAGQSEPQFVEQDGKIICCKVSVFKFGPQGQRYEAAVGVAYWDEYVQTKNEWVNGQSTGKKTPIALWAKMPHTMIAKCAEAVALRKAFPQDLSGLYTSDEIHVEESHTEAAPVKESVQEAEVVSSEVKTEVKEEKPIAGAWYARVENCKTVKEVKELYEKYKPEVDGDPRLQHLLAERRDQIKQQAVKAA